MFRRPGLTRRLQEPQRGRGFQEGTAPTGAQASPLTCSGSRSHPKSPRRKAPQFQPSALSICVERVMGSNGLKSTASTPRSAKRRWSVLCTFAVSSSTGMSCCNWILAQLFECGRAIHARHHHIQQNGVGHLLGCTCQSLGARPGGNHLPAGNAFKAQRSYFSDIVFVVDDENLANHVEPSSGYPLSAFMRRVVDGAKGYERFMNSVSSAPTMRFIHDSRLPQHG